MKLLNRFIPILIAVFLWILLQQVFRMPSQLYIFILAGFASILLAVWQLMERKLKSERFWRFLILPTLLFLSGIGFLTFLEGRYVQQSFLLILVLMQWVYFEVLTLRYHFRPKYQPHSLENISTHLNLIIVFFSSVALYSLITYLGYSLWWSLLVLLIAVFLLNYELVVTVGVPFRAGRPFIFAITFITLQIFWIASYLPTSVFVNGMLVTIGYYLSAGLCRNWLMEIWDKSVIKRYAIISILTLVLILLTAKYFNS